MFDDSTLVSGRHLVYYGIGLIGMLFIGFFRLDELIFKRKPKSRKQKPRRPPSVQSKDCVNMASDPDGTPWKKPRTRK
jgi:hypothetical protein